MTTTTAPLTMLIESINLSIGDSWQYALNGVVSVTVFDGANNETDDHSSYEVEFVVRASYHDDSFDHAFGYHECGHFEVVEIRFDTPKLEYQIGDYEFPIDFDRLHGEIIDICDDKVNELLRK